MNIASNEVLVKSENTTTHQKHIEVPRGWNRCLENGSIVYFSPSQICLRSKEDIVRYLISDRTCKCGLDCPFYIDNVFNFDASLPSRHFKLTKLENDHKTLCKETAKARFATLAQTQIVIDNETKDVKVNKPVVIKKKLESSVSKKKNETLKLPSFDTLVSLADANSILTLQEEPKPKKARKPASYKKKPSVTSTLSVPKAVSTCQTVHTNTAPILHSSVEMQKTASKDATQKALQCSTVSTGSVFSTSEHLMHPQTVSSTFSFPSTQFNASSFLAALSSATTIPGQTRAAETSHSQKVHPLRPFTTKSSVEHAPFSQKPAGFPGVPNQPNNVVYISSTGGLHPVPNLNSKVNWPGTSGITLSRLPQEKTDKTPLEPSKGFFTVRGKESLPRMVYPYPSPLANVKSTMSTNAVSSGTCKVQMKPQDLTQVVQNQQNVKPSIVGRSETTLSGHSITKMHNADKSSNAKTATKQTDPLSQPLQYCGILLQPGVVPQVQLTGTGARPSVGASSTQEQQNPYGNLYTLQGLPYGSNVANPAVLGMAPNTVIPYFLGIAQPGNVSKPVVPVTTSTSTTKESSPTSSTAPVSTSAIAAAYSAFVSIAPASVTSSSFSQQLVNLVSNYNNPYWQHLLTQGASANALAYQFMQIGQYTNQRSGSSTQTAKLSGGKTSSHTPTKVTTSSSRSSMSTSQESKPKTATKNSLSVPAAAAAVVTSSTVTASCTIATSSGMNNATVTAGGQEVEMKLLDCIAATSKPSPSNTFGACAGGDCSSTKFLEEKCNSAISETSASTSDISTAKPVCTNAERVLSNKDSDSFDRNCSTDNETVTESNDNIEEKMDCSSIRTVDSTVDNPPGNPSSASVGRVASSNDVSFEESLCTDSTNDNSKQKVTCDDSETLASNRDNSTEEITSFSDEAVASMKENLTETSVCNSSETLREESDITVKKSDSSEKDVTSSDFLDEKIPDCGTPTDTSPKNYAETKFDMTDVVSMDSSAEVCKENAINNDDITTDSSDIIENCSKSTPENVDMSGVPFNADSLNDNEYKQEVTMCTSKDDTITSEPYSTILECEKEKTENINNECLNVTADSEKLRDDCKSVTNDVKDVQNKCNITDSKCEENHSGKDDNVNNDNEDDNLLLEQKRKIGFVIKTDLNNDSCAKTDSIKDTKIKTESSEKKDNSNSLEDLAQVPTKTEGTSKRRSNKLNCDQDVKKVKEENVLSVENEVQKDKTGSMSNDTESSKEVEFTIGDIVWAQARGLPSWPGKIVDERDVGHGKAAADFGKKWVMWFGDHTFSQVEVEKLKTLTDGLKTLDDKGRKRKHRGKKTRIGLEQAISEALEELDQRDRLRSRQGPKAKKRRF